MKTSLATAVIGISILAANGCASEVANDEPTSSKKAAVAANAVYTLQNVHSSRCMDINGGSTANGANIQIWNCNGLAPQQFKLEDMGSGFYRLRNIASNKCVDVYYFSTADGGNIDQWDCSTSHNQQFSINDAGNGLHYLIGRMSGKAVEVAGWGWDNGSNVDQWSYGGGANQKWILTEVSGGSTSSSSTSSSGGGSTIPNECLGNSRIEATCAALAVAMAEEIGELHPLRDLIISGDRVALSSEGRDRCNPRGGCDNIDAILALQDDAVNEVLDESVFWAAAFRSNLVSQWYEQNNYEIDLNGNNPHLLPGPHSLTLTGTAPAYCGTDFIFNVSWNCAGGNGAISLEAEAFNSSRAGGGNSFSQVGGSMVAGPNDGSYWTSGWVSNAPKLSYNVNLNQGTYYVWVLAKAPTGGDDSMHAGIDGQENTTADRMTTGTYGSMVWTNQTMDNAPATINVGWSGNHTFDLYAREDGIEVDKIVLTQDSNYNPANGGGGSCTTDASTIENRMKFFRPYNTVVDFRAENDTVTIDPTGSLNGDGDTTASGCHDACMKYGSSYLGACCSCNDQQGEFVLSDGSRNVVLCQTL